MAAVSPPPRRAIRPSDGPAGLQPMHLRHRGKSHWWLLDSQGRVLDLTLAARETSAFPYDRGKRRPFRYTPAGPSRRALTIVERVQATRA